MAAGTVTPTEAGQGPGVLNIAANIGAKIRDAAQEAKEEREKAQEKGMKPKKGSLFKSALGNKFNPIKSKKAKAGWARQFDWNKKSPDTAQQVKAPSETGGAEGKAKLKEFIAGGFTAIIKDTTAMRAKMDGIQSLSSANLEQSTRTTGSLTMIKESVNAQTELRRKALEEAKFARAERKLERTKDVAGLAETKGPQEKGGEGDGGGDDKGGGFDPLGMLLGGLDLLDTGLGIKALLGGGGTKAAASAGGIGAGATAGIVGGVGLAMSGLGEGMFQGTRFADQQNQSLKDRGQAMSDAGNPMGMLMGGLGNIGMIGNQFNKAQGAMLDVGGAPFRYAIEAAMHPFLNEEQKENQAKNLAKFDARIREYTRSWMNRIDFMDVVGDEKGAFGNIYGNDAAQKEMMDNMGYSEGGIVPGSVPLNRGGIVDNPMRTMLNPGDKVIPLNRSAGRDLLSEGSGDLPMQAQAAMILGISAGMLGQSMTGSTGDSVKQKIRAASKGFGISNLNFTSAVGSGRLGKVDMNQSAENFMENMLKHFRMAGGAVAGGDKPDTSGGGGNPPAPAAAAGLKAELEADLGKGAAEMKNEIMQSGATGVVNPQEQPWCAAYVNSQLKRQGIMGSGSAMADSYSNWGAPVDKAHIKYGDVIVGDYGGGSKSHVMFAAGSPKDGAVDIIGGNQSGRVTRGRIQLTKIDYVRRASESVVVRQPDAANPVAKPELPPATSVEREAEGGGVFSTIGNFFGLAKDRDHKVSNKTQMGQVVNSLQNRRKQQEEMMKQLRGYQGGGSGAARRDLHVKPYDPNKKYKLGDYVKKDGKLLKFDGFGFASADANAITSQNLTPNAAPPRPAPPKTEPQQTIPPRQPVAETAAAVVMPPTQNINKKTADAAGSFGSEIPSAKVAAGNFADFLYYDLV